LPVSWKPPTRSDLTVSPLAVANLFPVAEKGALTAGRSEWAGAGEMRLAFAAAPNLRCQLGGISGREMGGGFHSSPASICCFTVISHRNEKGRRAFARGAQ
jgi:hypothetical protein